MISDLNRSLMLFFEQEVHLDIVKHVSYILDSFSDVREKTTSRIAKSRVLVNNTLDKIKKLQTLCIKKKNLGSSIDHQYYYYQHSPHHYYIFWYFPYLHQWNHSF